MRIKEKIEAVTINEAPDMLSPHIYIHSNRQALVEGCSGVIEYTSDTVRINCKNTILKFIGTDLSIKSHSTDEITINGTIFSVEFCS